MPLFNFILADGGISFSDVWSQFSSDFSTILPFFSTNTIFKSLIAFPIGVFAIGCVIKAIR